MLNFARILSKTTIDGIPGINLDIPDPGGWFSLGLIYGFGLVIQIVLGLFILIWIMYAAFAGLQIIRSQGSADKIEEATKKIRYIWMSGAILFVFFAIISIVGAIFGFGLPTEWGNTLSQCGGYSGPFYFAQVDQQTKYYSYYLSTEIPRSQKAYCCEYDYTKNVYRDPVSAFNKDNGNMIKFGIKDSDKSAWVLMPNSNPPPQGPGGAGFFNCIQFKG